MSETSDHRARASKFRGPERAKPFAKLARHVSPNPSMQGSSKPGVVRDSRCRPHFRDAVDLGSYSMSCHQLPSGRSGLRILCRLLNVNRPISTCLRTCHYHSKEERYLHVDGSCVWQRGTLRSLLVPITRCHPESMDF